MAEPLFTKKTLNPDAQEFNPIAIQKSVVPFLPSPYAPQGNDLVVYQPPPVPSFLCYYQQNIPFYWIHDHFQLLDQSEKTPPHQDQSCSDKGGIFSVGMKNNGIRATFFSRGEEIRGQNKKPFLPPRLMRAERGRPKGFFLRKPHQETLPPKKDPSFFCSNKTTVMIRNIPNQFRREPFMLFLDHYCCVNHWEYDFLYLPIDFGTNNNVGYAFVNFTSGRAASEIWKVLKNFKWHGVKTPTGLFASKKVCEVTWARIQGKEQLVKQFSCSNFLCETDEYLPVVFSPPRNGSSSLTKPVPIGKMAAGPSVLLPTSPGDVKVAF